jgi:ribonuclease P protein component
LLRLCQGYEFEAVFASGRIVAGPVFVVRAKPNQLTSPRLGIVATKKTLPRAVDRNRGKRLVREVFRQAGAELGALDVVVQLRGGLLRRDNAAAREELLGLFAQVRAKGSHDILPHAPKPQP